jgi:hypothetical protein
MDPKATAVLSEGRKMMSGNRNHFDKKGQQEISYDAFCNV